MAITLRIVRSNYELTLSLPDLDLLGIFIAFNVQRLILDTLAFYRVMTQIITLYNLNTIIAQAFYHYFPQWDELTESINNSLIIERGGNYCLEPECNPVNINGLNFIDLFFLRVLIGRIMH